MSIVVHTLKQPSARAEGVSAVEKTGRVDVGLVAQNDWRFQADNANVKVMGRIQLGIIVGIVLHPPKALLQVGLSNVMRLTQRHEHRHISGSIFLHELWNDCPFEFKKTLNRNESTS